MIKNIILQKIIRRSEMLSTYILPLSAADILSDIVASISHQCDHANVKLCAGSGKRGWVMRKALVTVALLFGATGLFALGQPAEVRAQVLFCPSGFVVVNGSCVKFKGIGQGGGAAGAFSGAALASQALSELSETTTQETTKDTLKAVSERREQEEQRCAEGFSRVDGTCQQNPRPVTTAAAAVPPAPVPSLAVVHEPEGRKAKVAVAQRRRITALAPKVARREPEPPPVFLTVPVEPAIRPGMWTQIYGDYEKRNATGFAVITNPGFNPTPATVDAHSRTGTVGFLAGADLTSRGIVFGNDGLIAGVMAGYVSSNVTLNVSSFTSQAANPGFTHLHANLSGPSAGLYATYFNGGFSTDFTLKADALNLNEAIDGVLAFPTGLTFVAPLVPFSGGGSTSLLNGTIAGNLNYRFTLNPNFWIEPTVGALYTNSSYGSNAAELGLTDGNLVMVQGGARFGASTLINNRVLMTTTLTGLAYDDVLVTGSFAPAAALTAQNLFVQADQGHVRGRGILALNFDCGQGITSFVQGEVRGGKGLFGAGGRAGVRVVW